MIEIFREIMNKRTFYRFAIELGSPVLPKYIPKNLHAITSKYLMKSSTQKPSKNKTFSAIFFQRVHLFLLHMPLFFIAHSMETLPLFSSQTYIVCFSLLSLSLSLFSSKNSFSLYEKRDTQHNGMTWKQAGKKFNKNK